MKLISGGPFSDPNSVDAYEHGKEAQLTADIEAVKGLREKIANEIWLWPMSYSISKARTTADQIVEVIIKQP